MADEDGAQAVPVIRTAALALLAALSLWLALLIIGNRTNRSIEVERSGAHLTRPLAGADITVTTWNLGYGGLGAESDFVADGGEHLLPPDRATVEKNVAGIARVLETIRSDIILLQETADASFLTRGVDLLAAVRRTLAARDNFFSVDFIVRYAPENLAPRHGLFSSAALAGAAREIVPVDHEPGYLMGLSKRLYHLQVTRIPFAGGEWSVIDVHLSAFDEGANVRMAQLDAVLDFAAAEYAQGRHVVIGGDWNLELARPARPYTTGDEYLFWLHAFPAEKLDNGWRVAADAEVPTVRTNERPYRRGENFTTVIDGFVVSPNVETVSIRTTDLDFQYADHQPVTATFRAVAGQ